MTARIITAIKWAFLYLIIVIGSLTLYHTVKASSSYEVEARITYYTLTGTTYSGYQTRHGIAACSWDIPLYAWIVMPNGEEYQCLDRGILGYGYPSHIDIWAESGWHGQQLINRHGEYATVRWELRE